MIDSDFVYQFGKEKHVKREQNLMFMFCHPNIVKLNHTFLYDKYFVFDMEFIGNGSLHALIDKYKHVRGLHGLGKDLTKLYMAQMVNAIGYL